MKKVLFLGGQFAPERVVSLKRNPWSIYSGNGGQFGAEYYGQFHRIIHSLQTPCKSEIVKATPVHILT